MILKTVFIILSTFTFLATSFAESEMCGLFKKLIDDSNLNETLPDILKSSDLVIIGEAHDSSFLNQIPSLYNLFRIENAKNCYFEEMTEEYDLMGFLKTPKLYPGY